MDNVPIRLDPPPYQIIQTFLNFRIIFKMLTPLSDQIQTFSILEHIDIGRPEDSFGQTTLRVFERVIMYIYQIKGLIWVDSG